MKKTLLTAACLAAVIGMNAGNANDYFKVEFQGEEKESGFDVVCTEWEQDWWIDDETGETMYDDYGTFSLPDIKVQNLLDKSYDLQASIEVVEPDAAKYEEEGADVWGDVPSVCFIGGGVEGNQMNCLPPDNMVVALPDNTYKTFAWQLHKYNTPKCVSKWVFKFWPKEDAEAVFVVNVTFNSEAGGVEGVIANDANAPKVYYNLQGVRVANPDKGLYIVRQGSKVFKTILK